MTLFGTDPSFRLVICRAFVNDFPFNFRIRFGLRSLKPFLKTFARRKHLSSEGVSHVWQRMIMQRPEEVGGMSSEALASLSPKSLART